MDEVVAGSSDERGLTGGGMVLDAGQRRPVGELKTLDVLGAERDTQLAGRGAFAPGEVERVAFSGGISGVEVVGERQVLQRQIGELDPVRRSGGGALGGEPM